MIDNESRKIVNTIFERLMAINPAFRNAWPTEHEFQATKKEWVLAFEQSNIKDLNLIKKGLDKLRLSPSPFIPSPGEFIELCKPEPEDIGASPFEKAYLEAVRHAYPDGEKKRWSHEAVKHAANKTGMYCLRTAPEKDAKPVFKAHYIQACEDIINNRNLMQLEGKSERVFTDVELHWIYTYKKFGEDMGYYPDETMLQKAIELYREWLRTQ